MTTKLKCILLVDDDDTSSMFVGMLLQQSDCVEKVVYFKNGSDALDYLNLGDEITYPKPELILLDVAMPVMDGWSFMEEYKKNLPLENPPVIAMFSSSTDDADRQKADRIPEVNDFIKKPLDYAKIDTLLKNHF